MNLSGVSVTVRRLMCHGVTAINNFTRVSSARTFRTGKFTAIIVVYSLFSSLGPITDSDASCFVTVRKRSCGKVMFLHLSVSHSVHRGGEVYTPQADTHPGRNTNHLGKHPPGQTLPPLGRHTPHLGSHCHPPDRPNTPRRPLQRTVRILLECILVLYEAETSAIT